MNIMNNIELNEKNRNSYSIVCGIHTAWIDAEEDGTFSFQFEEGGVNHLNYYVASEDGVRNAVWDWLIIIQRILFKGERLLWDKNAVLGAA